MDSNAQTRLQRNLDAATDDALVALANRGLVRRASKDLERLADTIRVEETEQTLLVHGDDWVVTMPADGPTAATDSTPATGVTRQIITATMFLREHWRADDSEDDSPAEGEAQETNSDLAPSVDSAPEKRSAARHAADRLVEASFDQLFKWSGKTPLLEASAALDSVGPAKVDYEPHLQVEFEEADVRVILMTDEPAATVRRMLDQFRTTAPKPETARWVLLAVLALKRAAGAPAMVDAASTVELTDAIRADRLRLSRRVKRLLAALAASGVAHPSSRIVERFETASVGAEAARFPRMARLTKSIADDVQLQIDRDAAADPNRMARRIVAAYALAEAGSLEENASKVDLFGRFRTNYVPAGDLELVGLGAHGWRSASGYEGVTTVFWDLGFRRLLTATVTRGEAQDPLWSVSRAYELGLGWSGADAIMNVCRSRLELAGAKVNPEGRLSLSESCRAKIVSAAEPLTLDFGEYAIDRWEHLQTRIQASQPIGLRLPDPRESLVILRPSEWGQRWFDELEQMFVWRVIDELGEPLDLCLPWSEVDETAVAFLESLKVDRDQIAAVLGRLELRENGLQVHPLTFFSHGTVQKDYVLCPQFDQDRLRSRNETLLQRLRAKHKRLPRVDTRIGDDEDDSPPTDDLSVVPPVFRYLIADLERTLLAALESGVASLNEPEVVLLKQCQGKAESLGLTPVATALKEAATHPTANNLLRTAYRVQLLRQAIRLVDAV